MKYKVVLLKTTTAYGEWEIEADSPEEAEQLAAKSLEKGAEPEEHDVSFGEWGVSFGDTQKSAEQDEEEDAGGE